MIVLLHRAENCLGLCDQLAQHLGVVPTVALGAVVPGGLVPALAPTSTARLLKVHEQCPEAMSCLPSLCQSCLYLNAYFKLKTNVFLHWLPGSLTCPWMPAACRAVCSWRPLCEMGWWPQPSSSRRVSHCTHMEIPVRRNRAAREGSSGYALLDEVGSWHEIMWACVQCDNVGN